MQAPARHNPLISEIPELKAEIRHNQQRIDRLQQRNDRLARQLAQLDPPDDRLRQRQYHRQSAPRSVFASTRTPKSRQPQPKLRQLSHKWLSVCLVALCLAVTCAIIGFAMTRLVSVR